MYRTLNTFNARHRFNDDDSDDDDDNSDDDDDDDDEGTPIAAGAAQGERSPASATDDEDGWPDPAEGVTPHAPPPWVGWE